MATIANVRGIEKLSQNELKALVDAANWIGINPDWLASVIAFETAGSFDPAKPNAAGSGATGLIQFMPSTAKRLGTSTAELAKMSFTQQLEYVKKYFEPVRGKLKSLEDTYLVVFYPKAIGKPLDYVVGESGTKVYSQNKGFDKAAKGYITKQDITGTIRSVLKAAENRPRVEVVAAGVGGLLLTAGAAFGIYKIATRKKARA